MNLAVIFPLALGAIVVLWLLSRRDNGRPIRKDEGAPTLDGGAVSLGSIIAAARDPELLEAIDRGNTITAIKRMRELTGMGLKESKDAVESVMRLRR